jgi:cell division septation protein DedD
MRNINYSLILLATLVIACSNSQETIKQTPKQENDVQLLDDQKKADSLKTITPQKNDTLIVKKEIPKESQVISKKFVVQLGAFSSMERAQNFINENQSKVEQQMKIVFRDEIKLFTVQLPPFSTHEEAEKIRNSLWIIPAFKDAFILTIEDQK